MPRTWIIRFLFYFYLSDKKRLTFSLLIIIFYGQFLDSIETIYET
jgi:hypothetical protein